MLKYKYKMIKGENCILKRTIVTFRFTWAKIINLIKQFFIYNRKKIKGENI